MSLSSLHEIGNGNGKKLEEQKGASRWMGFIIVFTRN